MNELVPRPHRFSNSLKVAGATFNHPDIGRMQTQERPGVASPRLRAAVKAAWEAYQKEYDDPKWAVEGQVKP